jgi:predicted transcriptional regulator
MKSMFHSAVLQEVHENIDVAEVLEQTKEVCEQCHPITPIICTNRCAFWKLKREISIFHQKAKPADFTKKLLNTIKNNKRLQILKLLSNRRHSIDELQKTLKNLGHDHSKGTIEEEYVTPLRETGLLYERRNRYEITLLGSKLTRLLENVKLENLLPPHSKCYEEEVIEALSQNPKTIEELKSTTEIRSLSRTLARLQETALITKENSRNYVFYFKTRRNPQNENFSPTEKRIYWRIPDEGTTAQKLAEKSDVSLRRVYKYLRKLRGKKLVFKRKLPKKFTLTEKGVVISDLLARINLLISEFKRLSKQNKKSILETIRKIETPDTIKNHMKESTSILINLKN